MLRLNTANNGGLHCGLSRKTGFINGQYRGKSEGMKLTKVQEEFLLGMVLGDGYLQPTGKLNARLRLEHGAAQAGYLCWKADILSKLFQGKPKRLSRVHPLTNREYHYIRHQSQSSPLLGKLRREFYPLGKKIIPRNLIDRLTPRSFAVWYMDDGYYYQRDRCAYLYLGNVRREDAQTASESIARLGVNPHPVVKKRGFALYFPAKEVVRFTGIIGEFILPEFRYKLPS